jgi:pimeloyl-ACP methyl ester carboxylesterase
VFTAPGRNQPRDEDRETCGRVCCPVLIVRAEHSELFPADELDAIVRSFPSASVKALPNSGHMVMWENPNDVATLATAFLTSTT